MKNAKFLIIFCTLLALSLPATELFRESFSVPDAAQKAMFLEHGAPESMKVADGVVVLDNLGACQGSRVCLVRKMPAEVDIEFRMMFPTEKPCGGYAGIIFQREKPGEPGIGVSLTDNSGYLQVELSPSYAVEYFQILPPQTGWHSIKVTAKSGKVRVSVDGNVILDRANIPFKDGDLCLRAWACQVLFDDIVVRTPEDKSLALRNMLANGSFEEASSPNMPHAWGIAAWGLTDEKLLSDLPKFRQEWRRDTTNPYHGKYCMRVGMTNLLASCYFPVQADADYVFSAWVRGRTAGKTLRIRYCTIQGELYNYNEKEIKLASVWQRVTWQLPPTKLNLAAVYFYGPEDEEYYVDAVSITQGTEIPDGYIESASALSENAENLPELTVPQIFAKPNLDKVLDDPLWQKAAHISLLTVAGAEPADKTDGYVMADTENLYIAMRCHDAHPETMKAAITSRDGTIWEDDCVEFFIGPAGRHCDWSDYYHLGVSLSGALFDGHKTDPSWNLNWQALTKRTATGWEMVAAIPFAGLHLNDSCRGDWIVNFCRENPRTKEYSAWSPTYGSFHTADRFGTLKAFQPEIMSKWIATNKVSTDNGNRIPVIPAMKKGQPYLPFGVTWQSIHIPSEAFFREMQSAGMNRLNWAVATSTRTPEQIRKVLDCATQYGVDVTFWILGERIAMGIPFEKWPEHIAKTIRAYKDHPAIVDWMVLDEPHDHGEIVVKAVELAKKEDPTRPVFINVTPHGLGLRIGGLPGDFLCVDRYGFFFDGSTLADVGITARNVVKVANETGRAAFICIQGMGHALWVPRCPTPEEMTAQSYLALVAGCTGFYYFNGVVHAEDTWEQMQVIAREFNQLLPIVISPETSDISCANKEVFFMARRHQGKTYLIAISQSSENQNVVFECDNAIHNGRDFFTGKHVRLLDGKLNVTFKPLGRLVFELF